MKITNMNRNQLASYAAQMRDRSRGLDRIMGELKGERKENRRLTGLAADANENAHVWQTENDSKGSQIDNLESEIKKRADEYTNYHDAVGAEIADLKSKLAAKPEAAEKVDGVFEVGDRAHIVWPGWSGSPYGEISEKDSEGNFLISGGWFSTKWLRHAPLNPTCQGCAAKDAEIEKAKRIEEDQHGEYLEQKAEVEQLKKAAHADWVKSDRTDVELYNAQLDLEKLQSQIETQRKNSADTQRNLERAREIIGHHEASILRVTAELTAALGGG